MANLGQSFDATKHDTEQKDFSNLPNGTYELELEGSEVKPTKDGSGQYLSTTMNVLAPDEYNGRKVFGMYNLINKSAQAQEIGNRQFASLCRAIGETQVDDSEQLHYKSFTADIGLGKPSKDGQYPAKNEIKKYYYPDEGEAPVASVKEGAPAAANDNTQQKAAANDNQATQQQATGTAGTPAGTKRPWGK